MPVSEPIRLYARHHPRKVALTEGQRIISYCSLDRIINNVAFHLATLGIVRGDLIGVGMSDSANHLIVLLALSRIGAVILPIDCRWALVEQISVSEHFGTKHVIVSEAIMAMPTTWLVANENWFNETDRIYEDSTVTPDSPLILSLSSGTTGLPKGPQTSHRKFENRFMNYWIDIGMNRHDRFVSATPLYFGGGRGFPLGMLYAGASVFMFPPPYAAEALIDYVRAIGATTIFLVPTLLRRLLNANFTELAFPSIQRLVSSGSMLYPEEKLAIKERLTPNLFEFYASTEGGGVSILAPGDFEKYPDSVGKACFRVTFEVVDEMDKPVPNSEVGRLRYKSPSSASEYYKGDNSEAFKDGWFYPGDLAAVNNDGYLFLKGRTKDMIIRGGVNIYPGDIEQILIEIDGVADAAVVGIPSEELGEEICAFVVTTKPFKPDDLIASCKERLAPFKVPRRIEFRNELPRNAMGKVLKKDLITELS